MNEYNVIRKVDELGRLVIPKDIRNRLQIKENDEVEMILKEKSLIITKYFKNKCFSENLKDYLECIKKYVNYDIFITDLDKIIIITNKNFNDYLNKEISKIYKNIVNERKKKIVNTIDKVAICEKLLINTKYAIIPIILNSNLIGSAFCLSDKELSEKDLIPLELLLEIAKKSCFIDYYN